MSFRLLEAMIPLLDWVETTLSGDEGKDTLSGGAGSDEVDGGLGNDLGDGGAVRT